MTLYGRPTTKFVYRNNVTRITGYGVKGDGREEGTPTLDTFCPGYVFKNNVMVGPRRQKYPSDNFYPASLDDVGFVSLQNRDYRLLTSSRYRAKGSDNRDPGCDFSQLSASISQDANPNRRLN
jgi:hypothetical protein